MTASNAITTTVPDIRLHRPAITVATMTICARRRSMRRPRTLLRMMMKGAANTSSGIAANRAALEQPEARKMLAEKPVAVGARPGEREADGERKERLDGLRRNRRQRSCEHSAPGSFPEVIAEPARRRHRLLKKRLRYESARSADYTGLSATYDLPPANCGLIDAIGFLA